jgi:hypothetical protein
MAMTQELLDEILIEVLGQAMSMRAHVPESESEISDYDQIDFPAPRKRSRMSHTWGNLFSLLKIQRGRMKSNFSATRDKFQ